jgi:hypothetical protein
MSGINVELSPVKITGRVECVGGFQPDPPLHKYPRLVVAPVQWGPGVRVHHNGASVEQIARDFAAAPNLAAVAAKHGVDEDDAAEAVRYATEAGFATVA